MCKCASTKRHGGDRRVVKGGRARRQSGIKAVVNMFITVSAPRVNERSSSIVHAVTLSRQAHEGTVDGCVGTILMASLLATLFWASAFLRVASVRDFSMLRSSDANPRHEHSTLP
jgi:hypothetical protein